MAQDTGIKENAYLLARTYGWELEYNGGLELDGEFVDDADLSRTYTVRGAEHRYVLNISFADTTAYGFMLMEEPEEPATSVPSAFGAQVFVPASSEGEIIAERHGFASPEEMVAAAKDAMTALIKKVG